MHGIYLASWQQDRHALCMATVELQPTGTIRPDGESAALIQHGARAAVAATELSSTVRHSRKPPLMAADRCMHSAARTEAAQTAEQSRASGAVRARSCMHALRWSWSGV